MKNFLKSFWQLILFIICFFLLVFWILPKACNRPNTKIKKVEIEAKQNSDSSAFYKDKQLSQAKETNKYKRKADSLQNLFKTIYLPRWKNRTKISVSLPISAVNECNDTIEKIIKIANDNDIKCDSAIDYLSHTLIERDNQIESSGKQIENLVIADHYKSKQVDNFNDIIGIEKKETRKERRKKNFWKTVTVGLSGLLIYQSVK